jgi:hypothetical protein
MELELFIKDINQLQPIQTQFHHAILFGKNGKVSGIAMA